MTRKPGKEISLALERAAAGGPGRNGAKALGASALELLLRALKLCITKHDCHNPPR